MRLLYSLGILLYSLGIRIAALFGHSKAHLMVQGWRQWKTVIATLDADRPVAWFHAASLGEFEQARPVLERFREKHPDHQVAVTFFSPSGYEVRKRYPLADAICYLPPDTLRNARQFVGALHPDIAFFVKYDFWFNSLRELRRRNTPTYIFSAIFRPQQYFFKPWGRWFRHQLHDCYTHLFVQNDKSLQLLQSHGITHCSKAGDTRFDRVHQIAVAAERDEVVESFLQGHDGKVLVCGSTWPPDEEMIRDCVNACAIKIILAPHVISEEHLAQIERLFPNSIRYSAYANASSAEVLIIDNIGLLSKLYRYADVAYIGGGFGVGIHNILEAVTFGKPVIFGPNYHKFQEAHDIIARGGGWSIANERDLTKVLHPLATDADFYHRASQACTEYMNENLGSTDLIINTLEK